MTKGLAGYLVFGGLTLGFYAIGGMSGWWRPAAVSHFFNGPPSSAGESGSGGSSSPSGYRGSGGHGWGLGGSSGGGFRGGK